MIMFLVAGHQSYIFRPVLVLTVDIFTLVPCHPVFVVVISINCSALHHLRQGTCSHSSVNPIGTRTCAMELGALGLYAGLGARPPCFLACYSWPSAKPHTRSVILKCCWRLQVCLCIEHFAIAAIH